MCPLALRQMVLVARQLAPLHSTSIQLHQPVIHALQTQFVTLQQALTLSVRLVNILTNRKLRAFVLHVKVAIIVKMVSTDKVSLAHSLQRLDILQLSIVHLVTSAPPQLRQLALLENTHFDKQIPAQK